MGTPSTAYAVPLPRRDGGGYGSGIFLCMISAVAVRMCRSGHLRYGRKQFPRIGMLRGSEHLIHAALFDDLPLAHDGDAVGDVPHDADVVRDEENCRPRALLERTQLVEDLQLDRRVECRGRLIGEEELRAQDDSECDRGALCHAAREFERIRCKDTTHVGKTHAAEHLCRTRVDFLT